MASTDDVLAVVGLIFALKEKKVKRKKRSIWWKEWLMKGSVHSHVILLAELKMFPKDWHNFLRMDHDTYLHLLNMVTPIIKKQDTIIRNATPPHVRLVATLRFLSTGRNYEDLKFSSIISSQALGRIIPETCEAIYKVLRKEYFKLPELDVEEWGGDGMLITGGSKEYVHSSLITVSVALHNGNEFEEIWSESLLVNVDV
ncbi:unnamed protein product [Parnassius apollo]|uniref:(apollo) hypothetical protein n=1 Tax=Parnassius apollo TaxID=110799 RepID=A0A8S3WM54_PARAO|nr:unnamed protein product [Parnassius apollo]